MIKFVEEPAKLSIVEKVCAAAPDETIVKKVLLEKWSIEANKQKYFDCL